MAPMGGLGTVFSVFQFVHRSRTTAASESVSFAFAWETGSYVSVCFCVHVCVYLCVICAYTLENCQLRANGRELVSCLNRQTF